MRETQILRGLGKAKLVNKQNAFADGLVPRPSTGDRMLGKLAVK